MNQIPTNSDIPSNSRKAQEEANKNQKPEIVPFDGETGGVKRKTTFGAWCKKMFLSDRKPGEIMMDVLENQIVPGIKDNFRNSVVSSIDMFVYQSAAKPASSSSANGVNYNNIFRASTAPQNKQAQTSQPEVNTNTGFANPCFRTRIEAERFLNTQLKGYNYPTLSVHTMYMMQNKHIDYTWDAYGWTKEEIAKLDPAKVIKHIASAEWPWMIDLPEAHVIS